MPNPVAYAEDTLGVHAILEGTVAAREKLDNVLTVIANARDERRLVEQKKEDLEMEVAIAERGKHADMSAAAMEKHLKAALFQNEEWRKLRDQLRELNNDLDGADMDRKLLERDIEIGVARMNQLGGYLFYLGAAKNASVSK